MTDGKKKLIEVALPLEKVNAESVREGYIYRGNPSAIHKWWAQRPLAACRAVLFASLVDDPSAYLEGKPAEDERRRLLRLIEDLSVWENSNDSRIINQARLEIAMSVARSQQVTLPDKPTPEEIDRYLAKEAPSVLDPFAGGGSIPLEARRLGMPVVASDLNPVAVLLTKALVELPAIFAGRPPINPQAQKLREGTSGATSALGLAHDVRHYGTKVIEAVEARLRSTYPKPSQKGAEPIAWLWARTIRCPNPACKVEIPLVRSFVVSSKPGRQVWVVPNYDGAVAPATLTFETKRTGDIPKPTMTRRGAVCARCKNPVPLADIREFASTHGFDSRLMATVVIRDGKREYIGPDPAAEGAAKESHPTWRPEEPLALNPRHMTPPLYGYRTVGDLFTNRQLVVMEALVEETRRVRERVMADAAKAGLPDSKVPLSENGIGALAYADAVQTYLAFAWDKFAMYNCAFVPWYSKEDRPSMLFGRQAISIVWDYVELNPFSEIGGSARQSLELVADSLGGAIPSAPATAKVVQLDASQATAAHGVVVSTDPPYYDNVPYADLSDFFYVWLRRSLADVYPQILSTLLTPKAQEIVADPYRHGSSANAEEHFLLNISKAFANLRAAAHPDYPVTIYYAFKQAESSEGDGETGSTAAVASTGWETMLEGLMRAEFSVTGTWPIRTERSGRLRDTGSNALASSILLVCRPRATNAQMATRQEFVRALRRELPEALRSLQQGNIAPVDLAQAAIGPGMAVYSRFSKVIEADGKPLGVRAALQLINQALDEVLAEQESEFDPDTRWCLAWFEQFSMDEAPYGVAETLTKAKNTSVDGLVSAGVVSSKGGKVRILSRDELAADWNPATDQRFTVWEATQYMIRALQHGGEPVAAELLQKLGGVGEVARDLAYRLYTICERKGWAQDAMAYNSLVAAWAEISRLASGAQPKGQRKLDI